MKDNEAIGGWAPGNWRTCCVSCDGLFAGDRLATQCEPCALRDRIAELEGRWTDKDCLRFAEAYHNMRFDGSENAVAIVARVRRGLAALREGEK